MPRKMNNELLNKSIITEKNMDNELNIKPIKIEEEKKVKKVLENNISVKYPSRTLEELRQIDFVHQYEGKLPKVQKPGYILAWICNTPNNNYRDQFYKQGYDLVHESDPCYLPPVNSGYSDLTGEDKFAHHLMQIPVEIYEKRQKALLDLTDKMYGNILKPNSKREEKQGSGMYNPGGRKIEEDLEVVNP